MFHKIKEIKPIKEYVLLATFHDGTIKTYDIEPLFAKIEVFNTLKTIPHLFKKVKVDIGGYGIYWNDEIDLSCDELWDNGNPYIVTKKKNDIMQTLQPEPEIITLEQYEALPENERVEVFDGVIYDMASPSQAHQTILTELLVAIRNYLKKKNGKCQVFPAPFDVIFNDNPLTIVQPDLMIICDKNKLDGKRCNGSPDFIIEIVSSSNPADDYIKKAYYYKNYGVREYWIVDPKKKIITVNYFEGNIINVQYPFESTIKINIYDDLLINFSKIANILDL